MEKKTKIICTIGPASWDSEVMRRMINAGMNVARVNGAFADRAEIDKVTKLVRDIDPTVALMMDVKGPEVRLNKFAAVKAIQPGDVIEIGNDDKSEIYPANYSNLYQHLQVGQRMVLGDGDTELVLEEIKGDVMITKVKFGTKLQPGKALNLPGATYTSEILTAKDQDNLAYSIEKGWEMVSASFVETGESARYIQGKLAGSEMKLIAKIENQVGIDNLGEILPEVFGVMVARGGLGVELGLKKVPMASRKIVEMSNAAGKPVIMATQMLESMITNPRPTRAEANDVATSILLGCDSVMLSGESANGAYPVAAVEFLAEMIAEVEPGFDPVAALNKQIGAASAITYGV